MKPVVVISVGAVALAAALGAGYKLGQVNHSPDGPTATASTAGGPDGAKKQPKLLYYRNPMGLPDTSPTPKKDPMGMDYIAVFEGESADDADASPNQVNISTQKVQKLGVRVEAAQLRSLDKLIRASGRVEPDERRIAVIAPKFEGYVERLHVNVTGQPVKKGQALFEVYSPELVSAQREYTLAVQGAATLKGTDSTAQLGMSRLVEASMHRLKNWDISDAQIKALVNSGETQRTLTFRSPVSGIVTEKKAVQGMRFMPGEALYQVSDLSTVWVVADVFEQDMGFVQTGAKAQVKINAYPEKTFHGRVTYVYPTLQAETRTVPVRVELDNPGLLLKPGMFAQMELQAEGNARVVTVPVSAVIDSGTRQIVLIQLKEGRYEPREVKLGARSDTHVEVREGVKENDQVVVAANFLIDAESNLKAAVTGFGSAQAAVTGASASTSSPTAPASKGAGHRTDGRVEDVDTNAGTVMLSHSPVASLKWPAMTMEFKVANGALFQALKPNTQVEVDFVERQPGEWVITSVRPRALPKAASAATNNSHSGH